MRPDRTRPLIRKVDSIQFYTPDLEAALAFYRDKLGHELIWRTDQAAGLRLPESEAEIVLQTTRSEPEVDLTVASVDEAARVIERLGGEVVVQPFDIQIGRCVVVKDPWGNLFGIIYNPHFSIGG